eukprot:XP_027321174.1 proline-rich proteoglycan 2-like [Anas platyrhynchos]
MVPGTQLKAEEISSFCKGGQQNRPVNGKVVRPERPGPERSHSPAAAPRGRDSPPLRRPGSPYPSGRRCSRLPPAADASRRPSPPPPPGRSAAGLGERPPSGAARPRPQPPAAARPERGRGPAARLARGRRSRRAPFCGGLSASLYTFNQWKHSTFIYLYKMTVKSPQRSSSEGCQASSNTPFKNILLTRIEHVAGAVWSLYTGEKNNRQTHTKDHLLLGLDCSVRS